MTETSSDDVIVSGEVSETPHSSVSFQKPLHTTDFRAESFTAFICYIG